MENKDYSLMQGDCLELMKQLKDASIDAVITDPPYQYLNQKLKNCHFDKAYNEKEYIQELKRCLKDTGFIVMFGRGVSFYRQGVLLAEAGFKFKEEIVWNKRKTSSPFHLLGRRHENCFIFAKTKKGVIRKCKFPCGEVYPEWEKIEESVISLVKKWLLQCLDCYIVNVNKKISLYKKMSSKFILEDMRELSTVLPMKKNRRYFSDLLKAKKEMMNDDGV